MTGSGNIAIGDLSGNNVIGGYNIAEGYLAGNSVSSANPILLIAGASTLTGLFNTAVGVGAGASPSYSRLRG